jgi:hypothetical protein
LDVVAHCARAFFESFGVRYVIQISLSGTRKWKGYELSMKAERGLRSPAICASHRDVRHIDLSMTSMWTVT